MHADESDTWTPGDSHLTQSGIAKLVQALGVDNYEDLLVLSTRDPWRYWQTAMRFCSVVWREQPRTYVDLTAGPEFPRWFPGARINWVDTVLQWAEHPATADKPALVAEREDGRVDVLSFEQLPAAVGEFATALAELGVQRGSRVGLLMENGIEATVSLLAIASLGAIMVPLFSGFGEDAIVARLESAGVEVLLASTGFSRRGKRVDVEGAVRLAWQRLPGIRHVVWKNAGDRGQQDARDLDWAAVAASAAGRGRAPIPCDPNDAFLVIYTSGTTGKPKGVVHTHGGFPVKIAHDTVVHFDVRPGDVFCWPADMGWIAGTMVLSCALLQGATLVCYDGAPDAPDWSRMSRLIERHRVTHFGSAPTLIRGMAGHEQQALQGDRSSLRLLITAGEGIAPEHFLWFQRRFGRADLPVINYTGGTEVSGALLSSVVIRPISPSGFNTRSPGVAVDVVDLEGRSLVGAVGELSVRAPFVGMTQSFWQDRERYLDTYWRTVPGVWIHGDLAMCRPDGMHFMMGRSDDTIKLAGKRLGPAEVEDIVLELPQVAEAAAIGVNDADKGQKLVVFVVRKGGDRAEDASLPARVTEHLDQRLGRPFRPSRVHVVAQLPKNRSTKIMRRLVRSVYCDQALGDLSSLDNPAALDCIRAAAATVV